MSDSSLVIGTIYTPHSASAEPSFAANNAQEIVIEPTDLGREFMLASVKSLMSVWMTPDEEEAWKDL
ncbi:MAG: hypothetical protein ABSF77_05510 [Spirochaetia bacterium]|jgi:hypothetical protein